MLKLANRPTTSAATKSPGKCGFGQTWFRAARKTWRYYFSRVPPVPEGMFREQKVHPLGAFHQAEIPYVFGTLDTRNFLWTDLDRKISGMMTAYPAILRKLAIPMARIYPSGRQAIRNTIW